jgi:hypothetical protein
LAVITKNGTMKFPLLVLVFVSLIFLSCEKDFERTKNRNEIIAGEYDSLSMFHYDFNPDRVLIDNEIACHEYLGIDSVNIDNNIRWDLKFSYYLYNDIMGECCTDTIGDCIGGVYFEKVIEMTNNYQIHTDSLDWAKPLNYGDIIDSKLNWCDKNKVLLFRLSDLSDLGQGYWKWSINMDAKYLGIRKIEVSDTVYGWILLDTKETIAIMEYAFNTKTLQQ